MPVPNVTYTVEIAFNANWKTPSGSRVWTDVSDYVELHEGISIEVGRSDELSTADANTLTLTLDNKDGRFTWGNAASPYFPNIKLGKPIRVTATLAGNAPSVRFLGFIDEWPTEWPGESATFAQATVSAKSRMAWIGVTAPTLYPMDQEITSWGTSHYWPLTDLLGSAVAADVSDLSSLTVVGDATFEYSLNSAGGWAEGRPGVLLRGNTTTKPEGRLVGSPATPLQLKAAAGDGFALGAFVQVAASAGTSTTPFISLLNSAGTDGIRVGHGFTTLTIGGSVQTVTYPTGVFAAPTHVAVTVDPIGGGDNVMAVFINGALVGSVTGNTGADIDLVGFSLQSIQEGAGIYADVAFGRVAIWSTAISPIAFQEINWTAKLGTEEQTHERLARLAQWAGIPYSASVSTVTMAALDAEPAQILDLMRQVEADEGGFLFDEPGGNLRLRPRTYRYQQAGTSLAFTTDRIGGYAPRVDRSGLANVGVGRGPEDIEVVYSDAPSREAYGDAGYDLESTVVSPSDDLLQQLAWRINGHAEPRPRVPAPKFSVIDWAGTTAFPLAALIPGTKIVLTNAPAQAPDATSASFFVEGYSEEIGVGTWEISPNLSPAFLEDLVLVLDSGTAGLLDTNVIAL